MRWGNCQNEFNSGYSLEKVKSSEGIGKGGGGVAQYVREFFDYLELADSDGKVECLSIRSRGKSNKPDIMVGDCYRPSNQDEMADEIFCRQL